MKEIRRNDNKGYVMYYINTFEFFKRIKKKLKKDSHIALFYLQNPVVAFFYFVAGVVVI
jgi:hypothetical protein